MIKFYAEAGSNHNQDFDRALDLIKAAADIGCTGVKFQYFKADTLWNKDVFPTEHAAAKERELPDEWLPMLSETAKNKGLEFGLSVFDIESVEKVRYMVDYFKIASFEMRWKALADAIYQVRKPLMMSMGMCENRYDMLNMLPDDEYYDIPIHILHCVSKYLAKPEDCNLKRMDVFGMKTGYGPNGRIGWSDHTGRPSIIWMAIAQGAQIIEFHLDLNDYKGVESIHRHCWPAEIMEIVIDHVRIGELAIGKDWGTADLELDTKYMTNPKTGRRG